MDVERPHRTTSTPTTTSELFICFTSRLSHSSSMRLSSKSILSPGRAAEKSAVSLSLPTSLSRRLRHNGSLKSGGGGGAQSPAMFSSKKSRGSGAGFDNPEPSSPKVTCIGQVRVKTKKQGKKMKMRACRSKRLSGGGGGAGGGSSGEASFRRIEHSHHHEGGGGLAHQNSQGIQNQPQDCNLPHRSQRWVHLPLTICEALRTFGAEFSCLLPCKSSCFSSCNNNFGEKGNDDSNNNNTNSKNNSSNSGSNAASCGAVFRWLVALQEGEGKERDIELVVREDERENRERIVMERECSRRRSIFDDMDFEDEIFDGKTKKNVLEDEDQAGDETGMAAGRVSVCVPPKNALLLMRCRSDPVKMSALSHKIWDAPIVVDDYDDEAEEEEEKEVKRQEKREVKKEKGDLKEEGKVVVSEEREELDEGFEEIDEMCEDMGLIEETEDLGFVKQDEDLGFVNENENEELGVEENVEAHEMGFEDLGVSSIEGEVQKAEEAEEEEEETGEKQSSGEGETEEKQSIVGEEAEEKQSITGGEEENVEESQLLIEDEDQLPNLPLTDVVLVEEKLKNGEKELDLVEEEREIGKSSQISSVSSSSSSSSACSSDDESTAESEENQDESEEDEDEENDVVEGQEMAVKSIEEDEEEEEQPLTIHQRPDPIEQPGKTEERGNNPKCEPGLPDCLLLMMCEPKLSMEVSKETWVCTTDFARWLPERHPHNNHNKKPTKTENPDESIQKKKNPPPPPHTAALKAAQPPIQPGRSSISFPASGGPVANLIEPKLVKAGGVGYEPFVLTRCKSAPMRSVAVAAKVAAAAAVPEMACSLWGRENSRRKMEPHRSAAAFGVGAAGIGF